MSRTILYDTLYQNRKRMIHAMYIFSTQGKTISIFPGLKATVPIIYLNTFSTGRLQLTASFAHQFHTLIDIGTLGAIIDD